MRERLFITISDERNLRQYSVNRFVGRLLVYALSGHTVLFLIGLAGLGWMASRYDALQFAHDSLATTLQHETAATQRQQSAAQAEMEKLQRMIQDKREQLDIISQVAEGRPGQDQFSGTAVLQRHPPQRQRSALLREHFTIRLAGRRPGREQRFRQSYPSHIQPAVFPLRHRLRGSGEYTGHGICQWRGRIRSGKQQRLWPFDHPATCPGFPHGLCPFAGALGGARPNRPKG